jgi:hypothetical protein
MSFFKKLSEKFDDLSVDDRRQQEYSGMWRLCVFWASLSPHGTEANMHAQMSLVSNAGYTAAFIMAARV